MKPEPSKQISKTIQCMGYWIFKLVDIKFNVRNGIEFQYPSIVFLSIFGPHLDMNKKM